GDGGGGADEDAALPVLPQPLHQQAEDAVADRVLRGVRVDREGVRSRAGRRARAGIGRAAARAGASAGARQTARAPAAATAAAAAAVTGRAACAAGRAAI